MKINPILINKYSSNEEIIGVYKNGKYIYRKYFEETFTSPSSSTSNTTIVLISNVEELINAYGTYSGHNTSTENFIGSPDLGGSTPPDEYGGVRITSDNKVVFRLKTIESSYMNKTGKFKIWLEYTKTTD